MSKVYRIVSLMTIHNFTFTKSILLKQILKNYRIATQRGSMIFNLQLQTHFRAYFLFLSVYLQLGFFSLVVLMWAIINFDNKSKKDKFY